MTTTGEILLLSLGASGILILLTLFGDLMRSRRPKGAPNPVLETYMIRVQSWWAMVILMSLALLSGMAGLSLLFAFVSFAALREFLTLTAKSQADHLALALAFFVVLPLQYVFVGLGWIGLFTVFIPVYGFLLLPIVSVLRGDTSRFLVRVAETQWGLMVSVFCLSHVPALMVLDLPGEPSRRVLVIAFLVIVVQLGDLLDFFFGRRIGRHKVAKSVSPKTWEGMAAGVLSATVIGGFLAWLTPFGVLGAMAMAAVASVTGMFGSIVLAAIKRDRGVRDWSHLIPGQGGFVDQLDSVIFAAPVFFHLARLIWT
jgi:phosphatidate cytidylyltransferase